MYGDLYDWYRHRWWIEGFFMGDTYEQKKKKLQDKLAAGRRKLKELDEHSALAKKFMEEAKKPKKKSFTGDGPKRSEANKAINRKNRNSVIKYARKPRRGRKIML